MPPGVSRSQSAAHAATFFFREPASLLAAVEFAAVTLTCSAWVSKSVWNMRWWLRDAGSAPSRQNVSGSGRPAVTLPAHHGEEACGGRSFAARKPGGGAFFADSAATPEPLGGERQPQRGHRRECAEGS